MKSIILYGHGGSYNHGCEAIVRSTVNILREKYKEEKIILYSNNPESDYKWGISEIVDEIRKMPEPSYFSRIVRKIKSIFKIANNDINNSIAKCFVKELKDVKFAVSIGGDNYCYSKDFNHLFYKINELLKKKNIPTIFWGCSISDEFIDGNMIKDLKRYNLITVRETLTQKNLKEKGIVDNVHLIHDTAFNLDVKEVQNAINLDNTIGINLSPMIIGYENKKNITLNNYKRLVEYILKNTNYNIALIPHVIDYTGGDIKANQTLYDEFKEYNDRVLMIEEMKAEEIKSIISKCQIFIGARTHATIAAYSTGVPTLVVGYSVKAKGIANDLFGTDKNYVLPVQSLEQDDDLIKAFNWIEDRKEEIRNNLKQILSEYKENINMIHNLIEKIIKE